MYLDQLNSMIETEDRSFGRPFADKDGDDNDYYDDKTSNNT